MIPPEPSDDSNNNYITNDNNEELTLIQCLLSGTDLI